MPEGIADVPTEAVVVEPSQTSDSGLTPEELLSAEQAKQELRNLQLREVADLIPVLRKMVEALMNREAQLIDKLEQVLKQVLQIHDLMIQDAETQFEITKVFQSQLIVLEQVNHQPTLSAATTEKP